MIVHRIYNDTIYPSFFSDEKVDSLTVELEKANDLILSTSKSSPISQQQLAEIFPAAAATSGLLKSGMTLTQVSTNYSNITFTL